MITNFKMLNNLLESNIIKHNIFTFNKNIENKELKKFIENNHLNFFDSTGHSILSPVLKTHDLNFLKLLKKYDFDFDMDNESFYFQQSADIYTDCFLFLIDNIDVNKYHILEYFISSLTAFPLINIENITKKILESYILSKKDLNMWESEYSYIHSTYDYSFRKILQVLSTMYKINKKIFEDFNFLIIKDNIKYLNNDEIKKKIKIKDFNL